MNETLTRPRGHMNGNDLRRHVLALVLFFVLVWYTVVSPSYTAAPLRVADNDSPDAEEREAETLAAPGFARPRLAALPAPSHRDDFDIELEEELDWPEIIGED